MKELSTPISGASIHHAIKAIKPIDYSRPYRTRQQVREQQAAARLQRRIRIKGQGSRSERIELARLIAEETGTRFVYDPNGIGTGRTREEARAAFAGIHVDGAGWIDPKTREAAVMVGGDYGKKTFETVRQESVKYAEELARRPDVDPEGPGEEGLSGFKLSLLQGLARHFSDPATRERLESEGVTSAPLTDIAPQR